MGAKVRGRKGKYRYLTFGLVTLLFTSCYHGYFKNPEAAYERGDYGTAFHFIRPLAEQGDAEAQYKLGTMYANGLFVPKNDTEAIKWYRKAADQGIPGAQLNLGSMYYSGRGVPQDYAEVVKWFRKAADQGNATAQNNLGALYYKGQGVPQDSILAHMWFSLSIPRYPASEKENRNNAVRNRDIVASKMTPAQIAEAQRLAREWKPKKEMQ
jgi:TPR repeat protein